MPKWSEFGEHANRLVYALAGKKYQGDIQWANRFVAERIHYSEVSVRMMRQGRFRPQEDRALETMAEIGCREAELGRDWANSLLRSGRHPEPDAVLSRLYPPAGAAGPERPARVIVLPVKAALPAALPAANLTMRIGGGIVGSMAALAVWAYGVHTAYPAAHELPLAVEALWGLLLGAGLALGMAGADFFQGGRRFTCLGKNWARYAALCAGGLGGALVWSLVGARLFTSDPGPGVQSGPSETFAFGASYGLGFGAALAGLWVKIEQGKRPPWRAAWAPGLACLAGAAALLGLLLAAIQPAFANQKDIDMFVGMALRLGLIVGVSLAWPKAQ